MLGSPAFFLQTPGKRRGDEPRVEIDPLAHRAAPRCGAEGLAFIMRVGSGFLVLRHLRSECFLSVYDCVCMCHAFLGTSEWPLGALCRLVS